jgi:hypothetical protein
MRDAMYVEFSIKYASARRLTSCFPHNPKNPFEEFVRGTVKLGFNRRFDLKPILPRLLRAAATTGPRNETWLRSAEHSC